MITNCSYTQLKTRVDGDLPLLGMAKISVSNGEKQGVTITCLKAGQILSVTGSLKLLDENNVEQSLPIVSDGSSQMRYYVSSGEGYLLIPKYNLSEFDLAWGNGNVTESRYSFNIEEIISNNQRDFSKFLINPITGEKDSYGVIGDIEKMACKVTQEINLLKTHISGDVAKVVNKSTLVVLMIGASDCTLDVSDLVGANNLYRLGTNELTTGSFATLGLLPTLRFIYFKTNKQSGRSPLTGNISDFVSNAISARIAAGGDGSGYIVLYNPTYTYPNVTWPEGALSGSCKMAWDAQGNITWSVF